MGFRTALRLAEASRTIGHKLARASLLSTADMDPAAATAFGLNTDTLAISRREAMSIPAVKRGRGVICGVGSSLPLTLLDSSGRRAANAPAWVAQPDPNLTLCHVLTWTIDDLIFNGVSWWRVLERYADGYPLSFERVERERVTVEYDERTRAGRVIIDGRHVPDADVVRFDGPDEGLLRYGGRALRTAIQLEEATKRLAKLDVPLGYLTPEDGAAELDTTPGSAGLTNPDGTADLETSEVDLLLDDWENARATRNTAFLNRAVKYVTTQFDAAKIQLTEQRQAQAVEIARLLNLDPRYVAAPTGDSLTYATSEGNRRELLDVSLAPYLNPIEQRLSMPDVTKRGQAVRLSRSQWMRGDLLNVMQAAQIAKEIGAIDDDEIRTEYLGLPPRGGNTP